MASPDVGPTSNPARRRAIRLAFLAVGLLAIMAVEPLDDAFSTWLTKAGALISAHQTAGALLFIALAAGSAMLAFFSSAVLVPPALEVWSEATCLGMLWLGWILGGVIAYLIGKYLGRPAMRSLGSSRALEKYEAMITAKTSLGVALLFQLAIPSEIPGYLFGMARYRFPKYLAALGLAELPYAAATVYAGSAFLNRQLVPLALLIVAGTVLGLAAFNGLRRRLHSPATAANGGH